MVHTPPQEELEQLFGQVRDGWHAEAHILSGIMTEDWQINFFDEANHYAGYALMSFKDNPPRLEFKTLDLMPLYQNQGIFTALYPLLGPWLQRYAFEWIVIRDWIDPAPFIARGFLLRDDPAEQQDHKVLAVDLRDPNRPSLEWVEPSETTPSQ